MPTCLRGGGCYLIKYLQKTLFSQKKAKTKMLYEPPKTKKYILIGAVAIVLAVLAVAIVPFFFQDKSLQTPTISLSPQAKLEKEKIQKEQDKLIEMNKNQSNSAPSPEQLQKDTDRLIEEAKSDKTLKSPEEIQKDQNNLINATKK